MATHLIVYGHGAGDPGAVGNGENERDFNRKKLHPYIIKWANKSKHKFEYYDVTGSKDMFQDTANGWGMYSIKSNQYSSVTEIHEDAASASATGGHVIISSSFSPDKEDLNLAQAIQSIVGLWGGVSKTKGISYRNNLLNLNVAAQRGITYRLMELGFITSKRDMDIIRRDLDKYAKYIIERITGENLGGNDMVKPTHKYTDKPRHNVRTYWFDKNSGGLKMVLKYLTDKKLHHKQTIGKDGRIMVETYWFVQWSKARKDYTDFLEHNNWNYDIQIERK